MSTQTETGIDTRLFIGGAFAEAEGGRTFENRDPWSGDVVSDVANASGADAKRAVEAAAEAFPEWSRTPPAVRQGIFLKAADVLESRQDEVVSMLARETGCTFGFGMFQMHFVPGLFRQAAALAYAPLGEVIPSDTGAFAMGIRRPVGVVGAIAPWNAALILSARSIAVRSAASTSTRAFSACRSTRARAGSAPRATSCRRAWRRRTRATPARFTRHGRPSNARPARRKTVMPAAASPADPAAARNGPSTISLNRG